MSVSDETILFNRGADEGENTRAAMILNEVYGAVSYTHLTLPTKA